MSRTVIIYLMVLGVVIAGVVAYHMVREEQDLSIPEAAPAAPAGAGDAESIDSAVLVQPGGAENAAIHADDADNATPADEPLAEADEAVASSRAWLMDGVAADATPQAASVAAAIAQRAHPERLTPLVEGETPLPPFDLAAFKADPKPYLDVIDMRRIWQRAKPGPDVARIRRAGPMYHELVPGGSVDLAVQVVPEAPVTFHSFDLGAFTSGLPTITVQADETGRATACFTAVSGTVADCHILATSPTTSGQAAFHLVIHVDEPSSSSPPPAAGRDAGKEIAP